MQKLGCPRSKIGQISLVRVEQLKAIQCILVSEGESCVVGNICTNWEEIVQV